MCFCLWSESEAVPSANDSSGTCTLCGPCSVRRGILQPPDSDHPNRDGVEISGCLLRTPKSGLAWCIRASAWPPHSVQHEVMLATQASPLSLGILALDRVWRRGVSVLLRLGLRRAGGAISGLGTACRKGTHHDHTIVPKHVKIIKSSRSGCLQA